MKCVSPISIKDPRQKRGSIRITVPCGRCGACKVNRRKDWSFRIRQEFKEASSAKFVTLTYDDENIRIGDCGFPTLVKRDLQLFIKRVRWYQAKLDTEKIRYYAVGEYGSKTYRPHYHIILFNVCNVVMDCLLGIWRKGHIDVGEVTDASIHYVTKYHVNYVKDDHVKYGREKEFALMSKGIGRNYLKDNIVKYHKSSMNDFVRVNEYTQRLSRYYRDKIFTDVEKEWLNERSEARMEDSYHEECRRLEKLGYKDPDAEIERRNYESSLKAEKDAKNGLSI